MAATVDNGNSSDAEMLIRAAREFSRSELMAKDRSWDRLEGSVTDVLPSLAEMGFLNMLQPGDLGGLGCAYRTYAAILHEISYASPSTAVTLSVHNMVGQTMDRFAPEHLRHECLTGWGSVDHLGAFAISEAGAGSDPSASRTKAVKQGESYKVSGEKMWITNGLTARWFLTLARTGPAGERSSLSMLLVDGEAAKGMSRDPIHGKMGIRGSETAVIAFDDVEIPCENLLGSEGDGLAVSYTALNGGRISIAAQATGIAEACLDEMIAYAGDREQFGRKIGEFQAIQQMISDSAVELAAAKALTDCAAAQMDAGRLEPSASSKAKLFASEAANRIAYRAVQVFGGMGYVNECRVEQLYRDARITTIYEGTSEIQRMIIAKHLLKDAAAD